MNKKIMGVSFILANSILFANNTQTFLKTKMPNVYNKIVSQTKNQHYYMQKIDNLNIITVKTNNGIIRLIATNDGKYIILGTIVDTKTLKPVKLKNYVNKNIVEEGIMFTFGKGKKTIYLVTDPQCPYCRMLEQKRGNKLAEEYKIKVILFPLSFHQYAKQMSYYILSGKTDKEKAQRFKNVLLGKDNNWQSIKLTKAKKEKLDKILQNGKKAAIELGVRGTPSVYNNNFILINPYK